MRVLDIDRAHAARRLLEHPTLVPLLPGLTLSLGQTGVATGFVVPAPGELVLSPALPPGAASLVVLRHGLELAWLRTLPALPGPVAGLLAARVAGHFLLGLRAAEREEAASDPACLVPLDLVGVLPPFAALARAAEALRPHRPGDDMADFTPDMAAMLAAAWDLAAPTEVLLTLHGDHRLERDPVTGLNKYGCMPHPRREAIVFSSCTASSPSERGFAAAEAARRFLLASAPGDGAAAARDRLAAEIRAAILRHYDAADLAEPVLAPSGTDATLFAMGLIAAGLPEQHLTSILPSPAETGSGVPLAALGRHFAPNTAEGALVGQGTRIDGFPRAMEVRTVALRRPDGTTRGAAEVDAACAAAVEAAVPHSIAVLHVIDGSKTGLVAPSLETCLRLQRRHGERLRILVDACQARLEPEQLRRYLRHGWPVLLTGSKFFGAPGFCGVVLVPRGGLPRPDHPVPPGLAAYIARLPDDPATAAPGPGVLLRWAAALAEMRRFAAQPRDETVERLRRLGDTVRAALARDPRFNLAEPPASGPGGCPTIFTFALRDPAGDRFLSADALRDVYHWLNQAQPDAASSGDGTPCHIGQPVILGGATGDLMGGLRIALSAQQAVDGAESAALETVVTRLGAMLDHLPRLERNRALA